MSERIVADDGFFEIAARQTVPRAELAAVVLGLASILKSETSGAASWGITTLECVTDATSFAGAWGKKRAIHGTNADLWTTWWQLREKARLCGIGVRLYKTKARQDRGFSAIGLQLKRCASSTARLIRYFVELRPSTLGLSAAVRMTSTSAESCQDVGCELRKGRMASTIITDPWAPLASLGGLVGPSISSSGPVVDFSARDACRCGHALGRTKRQRPDVLGGGSFGRAGRAVCCNPRPSPPSSFPFGPVGRYGAVVAWGAALLRVAGTASLEVV